MEVRQLCYAGPPRPRKRLRDELEHQALPRHVRQRSAFLRPDRDVSMAPEPLPLLSMYEFLGGLVQRQSKL